MSIIEVDNLSKKYIITHQYADKYTTLRDTIANKVRYLNPFKNKKSADTKEEFWALKDVSFEIKKGDRVGIIGRNGAGKSTLLKILSRITEPTRGRISINGRVASLLEVGTGFHPELTGRENIYLNGAILGMGRNEIRKKYDEIVAFSEVEKFLDTPVKRYSSGMYVRLAFAVAAHLEPEILIVDEVLAVGDTQFQKKCVGKMEDAGKEGRTILFVSHNMGAIASLCAQVIFLQNGRLIEIGPTNYIISKYISKNKTVGQIDLREWKDERSGKGPLKLTNLSTLDHLGKIKSVFSYDEPIIIKINIESHRRSRCVLCISLYDSMGIQLIHLSNFDESPKIDLHRGSNEVFVKLNKTYLENGIYYITIWLGDDPDILHDKVNNCLSFTVDNVKHEKVISEGKVRLPAEWFINKKLFDEKAAKN